MKQIVSKTLWGMAAVMAGAFAPQLAQAWEPTTDIELVVPFSAGGGSDINARNMVKIITDHKLLNKNLTVSNRPGATGATGTAYVAAKEGNPHVLVTTISGQLTALIANKSPVQLEHLTPLATLALDPLMVVVAKDSPYQTHAELIAAAQKGDEVITVAGSGLLSEDQLILSLIEASGKDGVRYVSFNGTGEVTTALLGGHVTAGVFNPSEINGQLEAGAVRALGITTAERLGGPLADVPTYVEQGYPDAVWSQFRGYSGPAGLKPEEVAYWSDVFLKAGDTDDWAQELAKGSLVKVSWDAEESLKKWKEAEITIQKMLELAQQE